SFVLMRKALKQNRLGLTFKTPIAPPVTQETHERKQEQQLQQQDMQKKLHERYSQQLRDRLAQIIKEQRLRITTLANIQKSKIQTLQQEHQQRLHQYQQQLQAQQQANRELEQRSLSLKESLQLQEQKIEGVREYFTHKLKAAQLGESDQMHALQENFTLELDVRVQAATAQLQEMLDMR